MASRKIEDLHKVFQPMVRSLLDQGQRAIQSTGWLFFITDGLRTFKEQDDLYASGRTKKGKILTNAKAGQSAHNYGLAVDIAFQKNGVLSYDAALYSKVYPIAIALGFELGANWKGFVDKPHFEHPEWELISKGEDMSETSLQACERDKTKFWGERDSLHRELGVSTQEQAIEEIRRLKAEKNTLEKIIGEKNVEVSHLNKEKNVLSVQLSDCQSSKNNVEEPVMPLVLFEKRVTEVVDGNKIVSVFRVQ